MTTLLSVLDRVPHSHGRESYGATLSRPEVRILSITASHPKRGREVLFQTARTSDNPSVITKCHHRREPPCCLPRQSSIV